MGVRRLFLVVAIFGLAVLALAPGALADKQVQAQPTDRFAGDVTMDQGETLTFVNADLTTHNVTADDFAPDGKPLFASPDTGAGQTSKVEGAEFLTTGSYKFHCSIHPFMMGTLNVTSNGTPQPRPGTGGGGGGGGGGTVDTTAPTVKLAVAAAKLSAVKRKHSLSVKITVSEPSAVKVTATIGGKTVATGKTTIAAAGSKTLKLSLNRAGRKAVRDKRSVKVKLQAVANDASGNRGNASATARLRG